MALFQGDVVIKTAIELAIEDIKKNNWLIDDIFSDFVDNPILKQKYGQKEIERAREFILNNKISFFMKHRIDSEEFPCITISMGNSDEDKELATLGDNSVCVEDLDPSDIGKPIQFIVKPFQVVSYDSLTGTVEVPPNLEGFQYVGAGMVAIDPETGEGHIINARVDDAKFQIAAGTELNVNELAIVPQYQFYRARRERITNQEQYNIGCHAHGDPSTLLFLFYLVKYALLRYREGLFEYNNFQLSNLQCTDMIKNDAFQSDNVFSRFIILSGQTEEDWIKSPFRVWEDCEFIEKGEAMDDVGIKILSNKNTIEDSEESENDLWVTIKTEDDEG